MAVQIPSGFDFIEFKMVRYGNEFGPIQSKKSEGFQRQFLILHSQFLIIP